MLRKKIYYGILFAGGLGFCQTSYSAILQCKSYTIDVKDPKGNIISSTQGQVCYESGGSGGWVPPQHEPQSRFIAEGSGIANPQYRADQRYIKSKVDPDADGKMNCYKNLTESSQDNYHMDDGDRFRPDRVHPVTGESKAHNGIDIQAKQGTHVYSMSFGNVSEKGANSSNGNYVRIKWWHGPFEYEATYIHLAEGSIIVREGETVFPGSPIGGVGSTGISNGPHLHLQLKRTESIYSTQGKNRKLLTSEVELLDPLLSLGGDTCNKL